MMDHAAYDEALSRLIEKTDRGALAAPSPQSFAPRPRRVVPRRVSSWIISRFIEGEEATAAFCGDLQDALPCPLARRFVALQQQDEERHAQLYRDYLSALGGTLSTSPAIAQTYTRARTYDGPIEGRILAFHIVLERDNLSLQRDASDVLGCPAFEALSVEVQRDEARHVAFGDLYLKHHLPKLPVQERQRIHDWLRDLWFEAADEIMTEVMGPLARLGRGERQRRRRAGWKERQGTLAAAGLFTPAEAPGFQVAA